MGSRDHSIECEACGEMCDGMNDARCLCDRVQMSDEEHAARYGVICATCDARGETPGTCACAAYVGTGVYRAGRSVRVARGDRPRTPAANLAVAGAPCANARRT